MGCRWLTGRWLTASVPDLAVSVAGLEPVTAEMILEGADGMQGRWPQTRWLLSLEAIRRHAAEPSASPP